MNVVDVDGNDITQRSFASPFSLINVSRGWSFRLNCKNYERYDENIIHTIKQIISHKLSYFLIERCVRKKRAK